MSKDKPVTILPDGGPDVTSAGVNARLVILDGPSALAAQARRMQNCLADYKFLPRDGDVVYAVWLGSEPATVELVWSGRRWRLGDVRGRKNAVVSPATRAEIETAVHIWGDANGQKPITGETFKFVKKQARRAAQNFPAAMLEQFRSNLQAIQGRSIIDGGNAFCVFSYGVGYIQFLSDPWGHVYRCEIGSHRYVPEIEACLTETTFYFLQEAGFEWPKGTANFQRQFFVAMPGRLTLLAQFSAAVLSTMFGLTPGETERSL